MHLILLGAPGVGKGTQAKKIVEKFNIPQISTGDILRKEVREETELGKKAKAIMERGELVPDDIILNIKLKVIEIFVPEEEIVRRLTSRRICSVCGRDYNLILTPPPANGKCESCGGEIIQRYDDKEETIRNRLKVYNQQTEPLIHYYSKKGNLYRVNGLNNVEDVFKEIENILDS